MTPSPSTMMTNRPRRSTRCGTSAYAASTTGTCSEDPYLLTVRATRSCALCTIRLPDAVSMISRSTARPMAHNQYRTGGPVPHGRVDPHRDDPRRRAAADVGQGPVHDDPTGPPEPARQPPQEDVRAHERRRVVGADTGHRRDHDGRPGHRQQQTGGPRPDPLDVPVDREADPRDPERQVEQHVQTEVGGGRAFVQQMGELEDARDEDQVEEELDPGGVALAGRLVSAHEQVIGCVPSPLEARSVGQGLSPAGCPRARRRSGSTRGCPSARAGGQRGRSCSGP